MLYAIAELIDAVLLHAGLDREGKEAGEGCVTCHCTNAVCASTGQAHLRGSVEGQILH